MSLQNIFIYNRTEPISLNAPTEGSGNKPIYGGYYLYEKDKYLKFISKEPNSKTLFKKWVGSR